MLAIAIIALVSILPPDAWLPQGALLITVLIALLVVRQPFLPVLKQSTVVLPLLLIVALGTPFVRDGRVLWQARVIGLNLTLTDVGLARLLSIMIKGWTSVLVAAGLIQSTSFVSLARAMRGLGMPKILVAILLFMYRYLFVLIDEAQRLLRARAARTGTRDGRAPRTSLLWRARITGEMVGTLFLRALERSERIYQAMLSRGYQGEMPELYATPAARRQWITTAAGLVGLVGLVMLCWLYGNGQVR